MLMFMGIEQVSGCPCPRNLLFLRDDMDVHLRLMNIERVTGIATAAAVALMLILRWRVASPALRRALLPIVVTGGAATALVGATLVASALPYAGAPIKLQSAERLALGLVPIAYLVGLFRERMGRLGVSDLIVELSRGVEPGRLRDAIARALRDPSLELGFWIRDPDEYVDVEGQPVSVIPGPDRAVTILERHGRKVAALVHDPALNEDPALLDAVSSAAGLALENERLLAELRARLDEVRDSRTRLVEASVTERRRLERNLHDGAQQRLVTLALHLRMAQETLQDDPEATGTILAGAGDELKQALDELRELARGLHPAVLTDRGLAPALQSLANRSPFPVEITGVPACPATRADRSSPLLRRRGEPHQRRKALRCDRRARRAVHHDRNGRGRDSRQRERRREHGRAGRDFVGSQTGSRRSAASSMSGVRVKVERSSRRRCRLAEPERRRLRSDSRMAREDVAEAVSAGHAERGPDEGGDRVPGHRRHVGQRD